jgi:hypothetical protein
MKQYRGLLRKKKKAARLVSEETLVLSWRPSTGRRALGRKRRRRQTSWKGLMR